MTHEAPRGTGIPSAPLLTTAFATGEPGSFPPARATVRAISLGNEGQRVLLAVAAGVGDPPSAEAQAMEALGQIDAVALQAAEGATPADLLEQGFAAANDALVRLKELPGSVPGSGAVLVAAIMEDGAVTTANTGAGAALLRRNGRIQRILPASSGAQPPLGTHHRIEPDYAGPIAVQPGDTIILCSHSVIRGLGEEVVEAVFEEFGVEDAAQDLADLAAQQPGVDGAAVALLHVPPGGLSAGFALPPPPEATAPAALVAEPTELLPVAHPESIARMHAGVPWWVPWVVGVGAVIAGALAVIAFALFRGDGSSSNNAASVVAVRSVATPTPPGTPVSAVAPLGSPGAGVGRTATSASAGGRAGAGAVARPSGTPAGIAASPGPLSAAPAAIVPALDSLAACDSSNTTPCRYTAQSGDSISVIGDRFNLTAVCFAAANKNHVGVPVTAPSYKIGLGDQYLIPNAAMCAALQNAGVPANGASTAAPPATGSTTSSSGGATVPAAGCTPAPGRTLPPPTC